MYTVLELEVRCVFMYITFVNCRLLKRISAMSVSNWVVVVVYFSAWDTKKWPSMWHEGSKGLAVYQCACKCVQACSPASPAGGAGRAFGVWARHTAIAPAGVPSGTSLFSVDGGRARMNGDGNGTTGNKKPQTLNKDVSLSDCEL